MAQSVNPITEQGVRVRTVTPEALSDTYRRFFPAESRGIDPSTFAESWLEKYEANPAAFISADGDQRQITQVLFTALRMPMPNTTEMAVFLVTNPDLDKQATEVVYVAAKTPDGTNVDLIVRAVTHEHAEIAWRDHFVGWDLPDRPQSVTKIPVDGAPGPISWDILIPSVEEAEDDSEAEAPSV